MSSDEDAKRLDRLFGEFVERMGRGETIDPEAEVVDRRDLVPQVIELIELAKQVATIRPGAVATHLPKITGFEIHNELGRGGMGAVYRARQRSLGRDVALKTILHPAQSSASRRERFTREARAVARLQHENIVSILDVGEENGIAWFSMELVEGRSLAQVLGELRESARATGTASLRAEDLHRASGSSAESRGSSYCDAMVRIAIDIARALEHAHAAGVVHRDVKPSNVLLRRDGKAMLTDFGLAQVEGDVELTQSGEFLGTPYYVSPEQASGKRDQIGPATDVWSLGATLYEMLTLEAPFRGATTHEILEAVRMRDPVNVRRRQPRASRDLEVIVEASLAKEPVRRYASMRAMREDLERSLAGEPISARPIGTLTRIIRLSKRHKAQTVAILAVLLLVTVAPSVLLLQERRATRVLQRQIKKVEAALEFQETILLAASPDRLGPQARIVDAIRMSRDQLPTAYPHDPELSTRVRSTVGWSLESIGQSEEAYEVLTEALAFAEANLDPRSTERLTLENSLGAVEFSVGRVEESVARLRSVIERIGPSAELTKPLRATAQMNLASALAQIEEFAQAEALLREGIAGRIAEKGPDDVDVLQSECNLGAILFIAGRIDDAIALLRDVIARAQRFGFEAVEVRATKYLASSIAMTGEIDRAEVLFRRAWSKAREVFGEGSSGELVLRNDLGGLAGLLERDDESEFWFESALRGREAISGIDHLDTWITAANLAQRQSMSGYDSRVIALTEDIRSRCGSGFDPRVPPIASLVNLELRALVRLGELDLARSRCAEVIERIEESGAELPNLLIFIDALLAQDAGHAAFVLEEFGTATDDSHPSQAMRQLLERLSALHGGPNEGHDLPQSGDNPIVVDALLAFDLEIADASVAEAWKVFPSRTPLRAARFALAMGDPEFVVASMSPRISDSLIPPLMRIEFATVLAHALVALGRSEEARTLAEMWLSDTACLEPKSSLVLDLRLAVAKACLALHDRSRARAEYFEILSRFRFSCDPAVVSRALDLAEIEFGLGLDAAASARAADVAAALSAAGWVKTARSYLRALDLSRRAANR